MKDMTTGHEAKTILFFALPMLLGSVFQQFYNMADSFVVGTFVGKQALAAVGQSFPVIFVFVSLVMGVGMASNILIAQFYGAKEEARVQEVIDTTITVTQVFSVAVTVLGIVLAPFILSLMQTPEDVKKDAVLYLRIIFAGSLASFGYNAVSAIQRGLGDSKTPLYALIISTLANVALDLAFVVLFGWGVWGVGVATVIAQTVSLVWALAYLRKKNPSLHVVFFRFNFNRGIFNRILTIGLPSGIQQALVGAGLMTLTGVVNSFGTNPSAAYSAAGKLDSFAILPAMNIGMAISTFTAQNLGAGRKDRVHRALAYGSLMAVLITLTFAFLMFMFGNIFMRLFSSDKEVIRIGFEYLRIVSLGYVLQTLMFCFSGVIRGAGATFFTMLMTLLAMWIVRIPLAFVLSRYFGTSGIWWSIVIGFSIGMTGTVLYYIFGKWERNVAVGLRR
jgi:putative MATE family efflux protein